MMPLFSHKLKDQLSIVFDIQSSVVRGALVVFRPNEVPHILWTMSVDMPYRADSNSSDMASVVFKAVESIASASLVYVKDTHAHGEMPTKISKAHCVLSSPWIISQARTISQTFEKAVKVTRAHVQHMVDEERNKIISQSTGKTRSVEEKVFDVRLNGYSTASWEGNNAHSIDVSFAVSAVDATVGDGFIAACARAGVSRLHIDFHSSLLLQHIAMSALLEPSEQYVLVHVHGELTDIVVASGRLCIVFGSYPTGIHTITRVIARDTASTDSAVDSMLGMYEANQLDPTHSAKDIETIQRALSPWISDCQKIISLAPETYTLSRAFISSRLHETVFINTFSAAYPKLKTETLLSDRVAALATVDPHAETLRLMILYVSAIRSLEAL